MRLFDEMRGHFALLQGRKLETLGDKSGFYITRVASQPKKPANWVVEITLESGNQDLIYCTDIIRVYLFLIHNRWQSKATMKDLDEIRPYLVNKESISYIMALLNTFDDVELVSGRPYAIRYVSHEDQFGDPVV